MSVPASTPANPNAADGAGLDPDDTEPVVPPGGPVEPGDDGRFRGDPIVWSWVAHRVTGVLTFFFLFAHVLDTALVRISPNAYDKVINLYKNPIVNLMELALVGAVLYHGLNGLRLLLVDFWSKGPRYQRALLWVTLAAWVVIMIPGAYFMLRVNAEKLFGSNP